jgi:hypothetical protein
MTPQEWIDKQLRLADAIRSSDALFFATTSTMGVMSQRIWGEGQLTNGSKMSYKEDYEVYIYKPPFPQRPNGKGKTGKDIKGQWAPTYLSAKDSQGRKELPFELTGDMRIGWLGGPTPTPRKVSGLLCQIVMPKKEWDKAEGLTKKKGKFLELTDKEIQHQTDTLQRLISDLYSAL